MLPFTILEGPVHGSDQLEAPNCNKDAMKHSTARFSTEILLDTIKELQCCNIYRHYSMFARLRGPSVVSASIMLLQRPAVDDSKRQQLFLGCSQNDPIQP
jgi:hypothetical protein